MPTTVTSVAFEGLSVTEAATVRPFSFAFASKVSPVISAFGLHAHSANSVIALRTSAAIF
jgi:hypothetical protein